MGGYFLDTLYIPKCFQQLGFINLKKQCRNTAAMASVPFVSVLARANKATLSIVTSSFIVAVMYAVSAIINIWE